MSDHNADDIRLTWPLFDDTVLLADGVILNTSLGDSCFGEGFSIFGRVNVMLPVKGPATPSVQVVEGGIAMDPCVLGPAWLFTSVCSAPEM